MNALFLCKTPYQIMAATRIAMTRHDKGKWGVVLFDSIAKVDLLEKSIRNCKLFCQVFVISSRKYDKLHGIKKCVAALFLKVKNKKFIEYDCVYIANVYDSVGNSVVRTLRKAMEKRHKNLQVFFYEDGFASYMFHYASFFQKLYKSDIIKKMFYRIIYREYYNIKGMFVFSPNLMDWEPPFPVFEIKKIGSNDQNFKHTVNSIFNYENIEDTYNKDFIFFEEAYYADGKDIGDLEIVKKICDITGKDNLFVKIHPRNPQNRFMALGIETNKNTTVPWEVIALNIDIKNKTFITISSASVLTLLVNTIEDCGKIVMLMDCREISNNNLTDVSSFHRKIADYYNDIIIRPSSLEELGWILKKTAVK